MTTTLRILLCASALVAATAHAASAQTTTGEAMFHWGPAHVVSGEALSFNFELTDHFGDPIAASVELYVEDKNGNVIVDRTLTIQDGHAISFVVGPDIRTARNTIPADVYAVVGPDIRLIQPCLRVLFPSTTPSAIDRMTATIEVMDVASGRVLSFADNPTLHITMPPPE